MGDVRYSGDANRLIPSHGGEIVQDRYGEESGTYVFKCPVGRWDLMPGAGFSHPLAPHLLFDRRRVRMTPGFWSVFVDFVGVLGNPEPVYELNEGSGREPIETHDKFESRIAGMPSNPLNGAVFVDGQGVITKDDKVGVFERFLIRDAETGAKNSLAGTDGFVDMSNITWTKTWVQNHMPSVGGKVVIEEPEGSNPSFEGRDWLYLGLSAGGPRGGSVRCRKTWRLSGPGGWNPIVYDKS